MKKLFSSTSMARWCSPAARAAARWRARSQDVFGFRTAWARSRWPAAPTPGSSRRWPPSTGSRTTPTLFARFTTAYSRHLARGDPPARAAEGRAAGCASTARRARGARRAHLALLTGNFERGAEIKLEYFDLWRYFECRRVRRRRARSQRSAVDGARDASSAAGGPRSGRETS